MVHDDTENPAQARAQAHEGRRLGTNVLCLLNMSTQEKTAQVRGREP